MARNERHWQTKYDYDAGCDDCDWRCFSRNALAVAAHHAKKHNHTTRVETFKTFVFDYGPGWDDRPWNK